MTQKKVLEILKKEKEIIAKKYGVNTIAIFGSFARGENKESSDIDIVVDMPSSFENFFDLKYYLEEKLNKKVDLIKKKNLRAFIKKSIQKELLYV